MSDYFRQNHAYPKFTSSDSWVILTSIEQSIKNKIEEIGIPLKDWDVNIYRGILTGLNEAFVIDEVKKNELISRDPKSADLIKPLLRGRDIKRYSFDYSHLYLLFIPWHFPLHNDLSISGSSVIAEKEFQNQYPAVYSHLLEFKDELTNRNKAETGIRYEWYALQRWGAKYWEDFFRPKVMWKIIGSNINFCYDENGHFCNNAINIMTGNPLELLQFIGLMNSKIMNFYLKLTTTAEVQGGGIQMYSTVLEEIPVKLDFDSSFEDLIKQRLDGNIDMEDQISSFLNLHYNLTNDEIKFIESL